MALTATKIATLLMVPVLFIFIEAYFDFNSNVAYIKGVNQKNKQ